MLRCEVILLTKVDLPAPAMPIVIITIGFFLSFFSSSAIVVQDKSAIIQSTTRACTFQNWTLGVYPCLTANGAWPNPSSCSSPYPPTRMTEAAPSFTRGGGRGFGANQRGPTPARGRGRGSKNKHWPPTSGPDNERWERGGHRGGGRGHGRGRGNLTATFAQDESHQLVDLAADEDLENESEPEEQGADGELGLDATLEERDEFWREVRPRQADESRLVLTSHPPNSLSKPAKERGRGRLQKVPWMIPSFQNDWKTLSQWLGRVWTCVPVLKGTGANERTT